MPDEDPLPEPISVYQVIMIMTEQMASIAWQKLGLQPDPLTGTLAKNLDEARVAIDVTAGLAAFMEPSLDAEDKRKIHDLIRDLKVNYLQARSG